MLDEKDFFFVVDSEARVSFQLDFILVLEFTAKVPKRISFKNAFSKLCTVRLGAFVCYVSVFWLLKQRDREPCEILDGLSEQVALETNYVIWNEN